MQNEFYCNALNNCMRLKASASAKIKGSYKYPKIDGRILFHNLPYGIIVRTQISGLPYDNTICGGRIFAIHIHSGTSCTGNDTDPFADANGHYNPDICPHPYHAGDLPPLFGVKDKALSVFLTDRFTLPEIIGKTIIIHALPDDFTTQPSGNSGEKIACGIIN